MRKFRNFWFYCFSGILYIILVTFVSISTYIVLDKPVYNLLVSKFTAWFQYSGNNIVELIVDDETSKIENYNTNSINIMTELLDFFNKYTKAKAIALDIRLDSVDMTPNALKFLNEVKGKKNIILGFNPGERNKDSTKDKYDNKLAPIFIKNQALNVKFDTQDNYYSPFDTITAPPNSVLEYTNNLASVYVKPDTDNGMLYSYNYIVRVGDKFYPSLALKLYLLENNTNDIVLNKNQIIVPKTGLVIPIEYIPVNDKLVFSSRNKNISDYLLKTNLMFYNARAGAYSHDNESVYKILRTYRALEKGITPQNNPDLYDRNKTEKYLIDPTAFDGKVIIYGTNLSGNNPDVLMSPISKRQPGVDIHSTAYQNLKQEWFITKDSFTAMLVSLLILSLLSFIFIMKNRFLKGIIFIILLDMIYLSIIFVAAIGGYISSFEVPVAGQFATVVFAYGFKFITENKSREMFQQMMRKYLSSDVMNAVLKENNTNIGGKRAVVTVLFSDIRGFTSLSEKMSAEEVTLILNEYFTEMEPIIKKYNGVINKFIGDAVMAIFGEPIQDLNHPLNAVYCAYEMLKKVEYLREKWLHEGKPKIEIGVGINTGEVFIGNIGSEERMEYTVIGDTVNLASRIESFNKVYKTNLLVSSSTYQYIAKVADVIKISEVQIRGKSKKMNIYEVLRLEKREE